MFRAPWDFAGKDRSAEDVMTRAERENAKTIDALKARPEPKQAYEGRAKVYDNVGGNFIDSGNQLPAPRAMGFSGGSFSWLDIDGEGDLDYFSAGSYFVPGGNGLVETQMHLYVNTAPAQNLAPSAPTALSTQVGGFGSVSLGWNVAQDDHTPAAALTYAQRCSDLDRTQDSRTGWPARRARMDLRWPA